MFSDTIPCSVCLIYSFIPLHTHFTSDNSEFTEPIDSLQEKREKEETRTIIIGENYKPKIEDQVFELFIDDDDCLDFQYEDDIEVRFYFSFENIPTFKKEIFTTYTSLLFRTQQ